MNAILDITGGTEPEPVPFQPSPEDVLGDLEELSKKYTPRLIYEKDDGLTSKTQVNYGCTCTSSSACDADCECVDSHGFFYDDVGYLHIDALPPLHAILAFNLEVRASKAGHGYGLFTRQDIRKGQFVCIYAGEVIDSNEARRRWREQSEQSKGNYILVIREVTAQFTWTTIVDPTHRGNIGRFINHACPPLTSLIILPVRPAGQKIPQPALFAGRDIARGEELSFDYADASGALWFRSSSDVVRTGSLGRLGDSFQEHTSKILTNCLCGSSGCRGYMPFEPDL
ncbi:hypothetical protein CROQUDRAFT_211969 [Cronartium quercuum f. sp. fusiforme G11]|uniref:SET domain-containing protein n=1 Tax=Cronartium quercuum f. sp. fusiforme G11 TaxID=708437 RepID=A0A9P6NU12_9BASI|nr:hypothetical protein CROQUDRAFT_211969 [Cronartium quercuum f. sp. fusiforme G11]